MAEDESEDRRTSEPQSGVPIISGKLESEDRQVSSPCTHLAKPERSEESVTEAQDAVSRPEDLFGVG